MFIKVFLRLLFQSTQWVRRILFFIFQFKHLIFSLIAEGCSAETSEIEEIQKEGPSYSGEITYSDRKAWAVADVEEATHTTTTNLPYLERFGLLHYFASPEDKRKKEEKLSLCEQFIANRQTSNYTYNYNFY